MDTAVKSASNVLNDDLPNPALSCSSTPSDLSLGQYPAIVKEIFTKFVGNLGYRPEEPITDNNTTYQAVRTEFSIAYDNGDEWFDPMYRTASTMAELPYPDHAPEVRLEIARFTCFLLHVDDLGKEFSTLEGLQKRILMGDNSDGTFIQALRKHLIGLYGLWDAIPANAITLAAIDYINGALLEQNRAILDMKLSAAAQSWPDYLRRKTGCSAAYAFMLFPKAMNIDLTVYISVIDDIALFTSYANDILSFHKEYLAGETEPYIFLRARVVGKSLTNTLQDVVDETLAAHARVTEVLQFTDAAGPWKRFVNGYLGFHFTLTRYRLKELGF